MKVFKKILFIVLASLSIMSCGTKSDNDKSVNAGERPYYVKPKDEVPGVITVYTTME